MSAQQVLRELGRRGARVLVRGDRLTLRGSDEVLAADFIERLRQIKPQLLETVRHRPTCVECGAAIATDEPETWRALDRVHLDCGRRAWAREWRGEVLPADEAQAVQR